MSSGFCKLLKLVVLDEAECYFCKEIKPCDHWSDDYTMIDNEYVLEEIENVRNKFLYKLCS